MNKNNIFLFITLSGLSLISLMRYIDSADYWIVDIASQFPFQYAMASLIISAFCLRKKLKLFCLSAVLLFIFNISPIINLEKSIHAAGHADSAFKVYSANIYKDNAELSNLYHEIQKNDPEIVLLLEVTPKHSEQLRPIVQAYPYRVEKISDGALGFVFLSKFPVHNYHITKLSEYGNSLLEAVLEINQKSVMFYGMHAQRPDKAGFDERKRQFFGPALQIREQSLPAIVAGDFNTTPYSPVFRKFASIAGLKDSREGFGWQPSWPTFFPPLWIPIDHVLVTHDIQVRKRTTGSYIGSDHYPVITELSLG